MIVEPIEQLLELTGIDLIFDGFSIKGQPGFSLTVFHGETTANTIDKRDYEFHCSAKNIKEKEISKGMFFSCKDTLENYIFYFSIRKEPIVDVTGWAIVYIDFLGTETI